MYMWSDKYVAILKDFNKRPTGLNGNQTIHWFLVKAHICISTGPLVVMVFTMLVDPMLSSRDEDF